MLSNTMSLFQPRIINERASFSELERIICLGYGVGSSKRDRRNQRWRFILAFQGRTKVRFVSSKYPGANSRNNDLAFRTLN